MLVYRIEVQQLSEGRDRSRTRSGDLAGGDAFEVESLTSMREKVRIMMPYIYAYTTSIKLYYHSTVFVLMNTLT